MQSDVTLVGGATPAAKLPPVQSPEKIAAQAAAAPPPGASTVPSLTRPSSTTQTAAIAEAKIALATEDSPTAVSQGERILKPYGVTMLPEPPAESGEADPETPDIPAE